MEAIDKSILFNSIILVLWTVGVLPQLMHRGKKKIILTVFMVLFAIEVFLQQPIHDFPFDYLGAFFMVSLSYVGGCIMLRYSDQFKNEEET